MLLFCIIEVFDLSLRTERKKIIVNVENEKRIYWGGFSICKKYFLDYHTLTIITGDVIFERPFLFDIRSGIHISFYTGRHERKEKEPFKYCTTCQGALIQQS